MNPKSNIESELYKGGEEKWMICSRRYFLKYVIVKV